MQAKPVSQDELPQKARLSLDPEAHVSPQAEEMPSWGATRPSQGGEGTRTQGQGEPSQPVPSSAQHPPYPHHTLEHFVCQQLCRSAGTVGPPAPAPHPAAWPGSSERVLPGGAPALF